MLLFRRFITSSGKLVLAGKDAKSNEELISGVGKNEEVFHTVAPGSPFVNIKATRTNKKDRLESAIFCASKSQDWRDNQSIVKIHRFKGRDIYKGKGMKIGTFGIKKKKTISVGKIQIRRFIREHGT